MEIANKQIIVTGGGSGIGLALARILAEQGAHVVITGRTSSKLESAAAAHERISPFVCDVTDDAQIVALRDFMAPRGGVDILINNAGVMNSFDVRSSHPLEDQVREIDIDVTGPVRVVHHFLPSMLERETTVVNVSSGLAFIPYAAAPVYSASKAFLHAYTQGLRAQLEGTSVRVVELLPPVVDTPMVTDLDPSFPRMQPEELAKAFLKGLRSGADEITPGQSGQLKLMRRLAPGFIFGQINKGLRAR